ncbi:hypothetical protein QCL51_17740 [Pseudomonas sp. LTR0]|uniref:hypothetical protein n=1 Tax=Pseudomonas sp. LTR0 TaxID=3040601 RepID=UPI0030CB2BDC
MTAIENKPVADDEAFATREDDLGPINPPESIIDDGDSIIRVISLDDTEIPCRYMLSPHYNPQSDLCQKLHFVFINYAPDRASSNGYLLRTSIEHMLDYVKKHNDRNPVPLHVKKFVDISGEVFQGYIDYLLDNNLPIANAEKFKTACKLVADDTGLIPRLLLPIVPITKGKGSPPLSDEGFETFERAFRMHMLKLKAKFSFREEVEAAQPYTAAEILETVRPACTKRRIFEWHYYLLKNKQRTRLSAFTSRLARCDDVEIRSLATDENAREKFHLIYERDRGNYTLSGEADPLNTGGFAHWQMDYARAVRTLINHGFPFSYDRELLFTKYAHAETTVIEEGCDDVIKIIIHRLTTANRTNGKAIQILSMDEMLNLYYPNVVDMAAILMFMMFQSGWNKETALAIDQDDFEHLLTGTIEEAIKVVWSEKNRSQGAGKPFESPKRMSLPTRKGDPLSFYTLIEMAKELSAPFAGIPWEVISAKTSEDNMNPMFACIRPWGEWRKGGRHTSIAHPKTFRIGVQQFLRQYEVIDSGKRLTTASELTRRFRPTWLLYKKKYNPVALLSQTLGHADRETTDIFYDNSSAAHMERLKRLRSELEEVINLLRTRQFKGLLGKQAQADAKTNLKVFHIPGKTQPLWSCADQMRPDWAGSEIIVSTGRKCFAIHECIFCSRLRLFADSLPYLMEREAHLSELLNEESEDGFRSRLAKEREVIQYIIDEWGDEDDVEAAERYRRYHSPLLPRDLKMLEIIFESEAENV